ncbi:MAG: prolyl oligopeptidase family serine peptidase [Proteobacteria bacterium]|nr:prolyl oligopeptidase family serine peptidase [Pseudomonadota bacterium]
MNRITSLRIVGVIALLFALLATESPAQDQSSGMTLRERLRERMRQGGPAPAALTDVTAKIDKPGDYTFSFEHDGIQRSYRVHVPPSYNPANPTPLLVSLHGGGGSMDYQASDENYGQISKSNQAGFIVVFPNGFSRLPSGKLATWNAGNCCGPARDRNIDDVGFIRQMVANLERQLNIDRSKIFATGMSNGGLMAQRLACEMSDTFKAIAPVAGTDNTKSCNPTNPVSVLEFHARNDDHLPFNGGMGKKSLGSAVTNFTSVPETISRWVQRDSCNPAPKRVLERPGVYCERYSQCRGGTVVELCVTDTGAHSWPGAGRSRGEPPSNAISANDAMWDFFMGRDVR